MARKWIKKAPSAIMIFQFPYECPKHRIGVYCPGVLPVSPDAYNSRLLTVCDLGR